MYKKLFIPGPTHVRDEILKAQTTPMIGHRTPEYAELQRTVTFKLQRMLCTTQRVFLFASSSTGVMEGAVRQCSTSRVLNTICGAFSDRWLLERQPHRVLGGMLAAGLAVGADSGWIYLRAEYPRAARPLKQAIAAYQGTATAAETGFRFRLVEGAGSYVCGEETALLNSIEGLRPEVRVRPPYPAREGLFGRPTLLSNVETFANLPWILAHGGEAFRRIGPRGSRGGKLVSLDRRFNRPGVYEVPMGMPMYELLYGLGGGFREPVKALQVGGPLGGVLPLKLCESLSLDFHSFRQAGFLLGHAGIVAIPAGYPMIEFMRHLFGYMAHESCGRCLPCRLGTRKGHELLQDASTERPLERVLFEELLETLEQGSLCALGGGLPLPVRNLLEHFDEELSPWFRGEGGGDAR